MSTIPSSLAAELFQARRRLAEPDRRIAAVEAHTSTTIHEVVHTISQCVSTLRRAADREPPVPAKAPAVPMGDPRPPAPTPASPPPVVVVIDHAAPLPVLEELGAGEIIAISRQLVTTLARLDHRVAAGQLAPVAPKLVEYLARVKDRLRSDLRQIERRSTERRLKSPMLDPRTGQPHRGRPKGSKTRHRKLGDDGLPLPPRRTLDPATGRPVPLGRPIGTATPRAQRGSQVQVMLHPR